MKTHHRLLLVLAVLTVVIATGFALYARSQSTRTDASVVPVVTPVTRLSTVPAKTWRRFGLSISPPAGTPRISLADAEYRALGTPGQENAPHILEAALVQLHLSPRARGTGRLAWAFSMQPGLREAFTTSDRRIERKLLVAVIDARTGRLLVTFSHGRWY